MIKTKIAAVLLLMFGLILGFGSLADAGQPAAFTITINSADQYGVNYTITGDENNKRWFDSYVVCVFDSQTMAYQKTFYNDQNLKFKDLQVTNYASFVYPSDGATWENYPPMSGRHTIRVYFYSSTKQPVYDVIVNYDVP